MQKALDRSDEMAPFAFEPEVLNHARLTRANARPNTPTYEVFLGMTAVVAAPSMRRLFTMASRVGPASVPVLVTGESGTGKELIARAVHHYSTRAAGAFIDINCAALPEHLMESELFGYERGAFSGAEGQKQGLFEAAHKGTLLLDEIGELDNRMQAKLLRVLDGQSWFRLGGSRKVQADVRVIASTNLDLDTSVRKGTFRRDLFHRLDALHLHVPPLRERVEDIAPLTSWFLRDTGLALRPDALAILEDYAWPGNIRELRNAVLKASMSAAGDEITPADLPVQLLLGPAAHEDSHYSLDGLEQQTICRVLAQTGGHQQKAADLLGISRRTLIRKLKIYRSPAHHGAA